MNFKHRVLMLLTLCALSYHQKLIAQNLAFTQQDIIKTSGITSESQIENLPLNNIDATRTYYDGLFRTVQTVALQASPNSNHDIVQPIAYNSLGQQAITYLPFVDNSGNYEVGSYRPDATTLETNYYSTNTSAGNKVAADANPYNQQVFENSPLLRVLKEGMVGSGFQPLTGQKFKTINYRSNSSNDAVIQWGTDGSYNASAPNYSANQLNVTEFTNEDGSKIITFEDNNGKLVLKRQVKTTPSALNLDTYYIYNNAGNLSYVIPPKAIALMTTSHSLTQTGVNKMIFQYVYDNLGRLVEKTSPGAVPVYMIYDPLNRPVLIQDGNLRNTNQWNYIKYDIKGRAVSQGIYTDAVHTTRTGSTTGMQDYVSALPAYNTAWFERRSSTSSTGYYTNTIFPTVNQNGTALKDLAYSYFDDYNLTQGTLPDYNYTSASLSGEPLQQNKLTRGMQTMVRKRTVGTGLANIWLVKVIFYDKRGNVIQVKSNNQLNYTAATSTAPELASDAQTSIPDFTGKPVLTKVVKITGNGATTTSVITAFTYDSHNSRIAAIAQSYDNGANYKGIASYTYNELGQLVVRKLGKIGVTSNYLQNVDYRYNIRGQVLTINNSTLSNQANTSTDTNDIFGAEYSYELPDMSSATPSFTGKISEVKWIARNTTSALNSPERSYVYKYDELDRLNGAMYSDRVGGATTWINANAFDEGNITYDENGNVLSLKRNSGSATNVIDNLTYNYAAANPNLLTSVTDLGTSAGFAGGTGSYAYDANSGNLTIDPYKKLQISYNELNRTQQITQTLLPSQNIVYTYDAGGTVIRKQVNGSTSYYMDYLDGMIYRNGVLQEFKTPEGRVVFGGGVYTPQYVIADQQGNARVTFQDNGSGTASVVQENSYYGFGMVMATNFVPASGVPNNNLYNGGSEWQNDYNNLPDYYQTFFRNYDAALGRFISIDPIAESAASMSPYQYALNNPIMNNDPNGDQVPPRWLADIYNNAPNGTPSYWGADGRRLENESGIGGFGLNGNFGEVGTNNGGPFSGKTGVAEFTAQSIASVNYVGQHRSFVYWTQAPVDEGIGVKATKHTVGYNQRSGDVVLGLTGASLDELSKIKSSVGIYTQRTAFSYHANGWRGSQYVNTFRLGKGFDGLSLGLSVYTTGKAIDDIANGEPSVLTYADAGVGTIGLGARFFSYFSGVQYPVIGEAVAIYGAVRMGWDIGKPMGEANRQYLESAREEGCGICTLSH